MTDRWSRRIVMLQVGFSAISLPWVLTLYFTRGRSAWFLALLVLLLIGTVALALVRRTMHGLPTTTVAFLLLAVNGVMALGAATIEPWTAQISTLALLLPLVLATSSSSRIGFIRLAVVTAALEVSVTLTARLTGGFGLIDALQESDRTLLLAFFVPALSGAFLLHSWHDFVQLAERNEALRQSQRRLVGSSDRARGRLKRELDDQFAPALTSIADDIRLLQRSEAIRPVDEITSYLDAVESLNTELRQTTHGAYPAALAQHGLAHAVATRTLLSPVEVRLSSSSEDRSAQPIEAVAYMCFNVILSEIEGGQSTGPVNVRIVAGAPGLDLHIAVVSGRRLAPETLEEITDRVGAVGGEIQTTDSDFSWSVEIAIASSTIIPSRPSASTRQTPTARQALAPGLIFAGLSAILSVWLATTILPYDGMHTIAWASSGALFIPSLLAYLIAARAPGAAMIILAISWWTTAFVVVDHANLIQDFATVALLLPALIALPHVDRRVYALLATGTAASVTILTTFSRFDRSSSFTTKSPDWLNDTIVIGFVTLTIGLIALASYRLLSTLKQNTSALQEGRRRIVTSADAGRRELERRLHDSVQPRLVSAAIRLRVCERIADGEAERLNTQLESAQSEIEAAATELRLAVSGLHPLELTTFGFAEALTRLAERHDAEAIVTDLVPLDPEIETAVYLACSEALTNATKHSGAAAERQLFAGLDGDEVVFRVADDGPGFELSATPGHGLCNIKDRVVAVGGTLEVHSTPGAGTTVAGRIPSATVAN